jgi:hypothetical protein
MRKFTCSKCGISVIGHCLLDLCPVHFSEAAAGAFVNTNRKARLMPVESLEAQMKRAIENYKKSWGYT